MENKFKKILLVLLTVCLFQTSFYMTRAEDKTTKINEEEKSEVKEETKEEINEEIKEEVKEETKEETPKINEEVSNEPHTITINTPTGGTIATSPSGTAEAGSQVTITPTPEEGCEFTSVSVVDESGSSVTVTDNTFTMPDSNVTISAVFTPISYAINVNSNVRGGDVDIVKKTATKGTTVVFSFKDIWEGYEINVDGISVVDENGNNIKYVVEYDQGETYVGFKMPASAVTITPAFTVDTTHVFKIDRSNIVAETTIKFYKKLDDGSWMEIPDGSGAEVGKEIKWTLALDPGAVLTLFRVYYENKIDGTVRLVNITKAKIQYEGTFTMPAQSITATSKANVPIPHCKDYNEETETCNVCAEGYERSADGKSCYQNTPKSFATDDWALVNKCATSTTGCVYQVGDERVITIDGTEYLIRIANMSNKACKLDPDHSESACGFVIEFVKCIKMMDMNINQTATKSKTDGSWSQSDVYKYINGDFLNKLKQNKSTGGTTPLGDVMIETNVITGSNYGEKQKGIQTYSQKCYLYLLSLHEVFEGSKTSSKPDVDYDVAEMDNGYDYTHQLEFYKNNNVTTTGDTTIKNVLTKYRSDNGQDSDWWLRTPSNQKENNNTHYYLVGKESASGYKRLLSNFEGFLWSIASMKGYEKGVAPAFRIGKVS